MKRNINILWLSCMFKPQFSLIKRADHIEMTRKSRLVREKIFAEIKQLHNEEVSKLNYVSEQPKLLKSFDNISQLNEGHLDWYVFLTSYTLKNIK